MSGKRGISVLPLHYRTVGREPYPVRLTGVLYGQFITLGLAARRTTLATYIQGFTIMPNKFVAKRKGCGVMELITLRIRLGEVGRAGLEPAT